MQRVKDEREHGQSPQPKVIQCEGRGAVQHRGEIAANTRQQGVSEYAAEGGCMGGKVRESRKHGRG